MILVTTFEVPGKRIKETLGLVKGNTVQRSCLPTERQWLLSSKRDI